MKRNIYTKTEQQMRNFWRKTESASLENMSEVYFGKCDRKDSQCKPNKDRRLQINVVLQYTNKDESFWKENTLHRVCYVISFYFILILSKNRHFLVDKITQLCSPKMNSDPSKRSI